MTIALALGWSERALQKRPEVGHLLIVAQEKLAVTGVGSNAVGLGDNNAALGGAEVPPG